MAGIEAHLTLLADASDKCRQSTLASHQIQLGEVHQGDADLVLWLNHLDGPTVPMMVTARRELALAEYSAASGLYRQAFASLRLFLELNFAAVYFSVNELERRRWVSDRFDFSWSSALNSETGILSGMFVSEFAPDLMMDATDHSRRAQACYRYCSQFIHGKHKDSERLPTTLEYSSDVLTEWCEKAKQATEVVLFVLYVRYGDIANDKANDDLRTMLLTRFNHISQIRSRLGGVSNG
ncbi:hypothetical protein [Mycobacterium sp. MS1601]|uniref:hypothetical protein n=1 Tax=Mycobacterium sp. MS1601 TaxID=1936029 RepID=UPI0012FBB572|nr:hypothetical protein [Mycobacterium sp. MS1601]